MIYIIQLYIKPIVMLGDVNVTWNPLNSRWHDAPAVRLEPFLIKRCQHQPADRMHQSYRVVGRGRGTRAGLHAL